MSLIKRMRKQKAVYWARQDTPDEFGRYVYDAPVEVRCRWDDEMREFIDAHGTRQMSVAVVYVDRDMRLGDKLKLGTLDSLEDSNDSNDTNDSNDSPPTVDGAYEIQAWMKNPNLKAKEFLRTAILGNERPR